MVVEGKNLDISISQTHNLVRNIHNYHRLFLNPMNNIKITFLKLWRDLESVNENHTSDSDVLESNPHGENEEVS